MSTILKALRRLEREKTQEGRPLREQVTTEGAYRGDPSPTRRWPILLGGMGAGVLAGLAVLALVFARGESAEEAARATPEPAAQSGAAEAPPPPAAPARTRVRPNAGAERLARERAAASAGAPAPELLEEVAVLDRGTPGPRIVEAEPAPNAADAAPKPGSLRPMKHPDPRALPGAHVLPDAAGARPGPTEVVASAPAPVPTAPPEPAPAAEPLPTPRAAPVATAEVVRPAQRTEAAPKPHAGAPAPEAAPPKRAPAKTASAAPASFPELRVARTTWHPQAERRVAVIELPDGETQSVHEGDRVGSAVVKRIDPSGVVFEQAGREFRRKLGERGGRS